MSLSTGNITSTRGVAAKEDRWEHHFDAVSTPTIGVKDGSIDELQTKSTDRFMIGYVIVSLLPDAVVLNATRFVGAHFPLRKLKTRLSCRARFVWTHLIDNKT
jgi:hypothetical protein